MSGWGGVNGSGSAGSSRTLDPYKSAYSSSSRPASPAPSFGKAFTVQKADHLSYGEGDRVRHLKFGEGTVQKIELYYTTLMTIDSRRIVIPNSVLTNDSITNVTAMEKRRLEIKVGISYESDLLLAKQILRELIEKDPELLEREETQVFVDELGDSAVILGLRAWVKTEEFWNTKWRMNEQIKLEFDKRGIQIPYPQMDVHMHH